MEAEERLTGQGDEEIEEAEVNEPDTDTEEEVQVPQNPVDQGSTRSSSNTVDERDISSWEGQADRFTERG